MAGSVASPPRLARAILRWRLRPTAREFLVGDLDEEFHDHVLPARGPLRARLWYWRQTFATLRAMSARTERSPRSGSEPIMDTILQDIRFALRSWRRNPLPTLIALVALALGIGANTAIFSVVHAVLINPLPYPQDDRLMTLWLDNRLQGWPQDVTSYPNFEDWRAGGETFAEMAALSHQLDTITGIGEPHRVRVTAVSPRFFDVLGVPAAIGRTFSTEDWRSDERLVVLSHGAWQRDHGADPAVIGETLLLDGTPHTIVGVMPKGFYYDREDVAHWRLFARSVTESSRGQLWLRVVGRLEDGVTLEQARADMDNVGRQLEERLPEYNTGYGVSVVPLREEIVGDVRPALLVLLGAVGLVLLIACANVANLMLTRAIARRREIAVRSALGASGGRIARQTLTESLLLALTGATAGVGVAFAGLRLLRSLQPDLPRLADVGLNGPVLGFTVGTACLTGLLFGAVPALHARASDLVDALKERTGPPAGSGRLRASLVVVEVALALVLLIGAGLLLRSYGSLLSVSPGFEAEGAMRMRVSLSGDRYQDGDDARRFFSDLIGRLESLPGDPEVAGIWHPPMSGGYSSGFLTVEGQAPVPREEMREVKFNRVTPGWFETMRVPLLAGRPFEPTDNADAEVVLVVNETFAERWFPDREAVGGRILVGQPEDYATEEEPDPELPWMRIVGVVGDVKQRSLTRSADPEIFIPFEQSPTGTLDLVLRSEGDPLALAGAARQAVWDIDPELPVANVERAEDAVRRDTAGQRFNLTLVALFAALALTLATIGIYGVVAHWVRQQTREIGVRMALGAAAGDVRKMVLRQTLTTTLIGVGLGLLVAAVASRAMAGLLYGIGALDPLTFGGVSALAIVVALATAWLPARRATSIDPAIALRAD